MSSLPAERERAPKPAGAWSTALVVAACSVFPDTAVLPGAGGNSGTGGVHVAGGSASHSGGTGGVGIPNGGSGGDTAGNANTGGTNIGGAVDTGGAMMGAAGNAGGANTGGANTGGANTGGGVGDGGAAGSGVGCGATTSLILSATADSYLSELDSKTNFGQDARLRVSGVVADHLRTVIAFDLSTLPVGTSVGRAVLHLALGATLTDAHSLSLYALTMPFSENRVSWDRAMQNSKWTTSGGDTAVRESTQQVVGSGLQAGALVDFDLSDDVGRIAQGTWQNNGWLVMSAQGDPPLEFISRESASFPEQRPRLELTLCH